METSFESIISARLDIAQKERIAVKEALDALDTKVKSWIAKIGEKPRETLEELSVLLKHLEYCHATTSQSNSDERQFMRSMDKIRQKKKLLADYNRIQDELDTLKSRRSNLADELREKDRTIDELYAGIRRVRTAGKLGCSTAEVKEKIMVVPQEKLPQIIGKGGANLRKLEETCRVTIDKDRRGAIRIMGSDETISCAEDAILIIVNTVTEEISPSDETIVCMMLRKAEFVHAIQKQFNVRMDVSRAKRVCKISGLLENVQPAVAEINAIESCRIEIMIEEKALPVICGKGGETINALETGNRVQINISREEKLIVVLGFKFDVELVSNKLKEIIEKNREVEEEIKVSKSIAFCCVIGPQGRIARNLQSQYNVSIRIMKSEEGNFEGILIKGTTTRVLTARQHVFRLIGTHMSQTVEVEVSKEVIPVIIGKNGVNLKALRHKYPHSNIDIEGCFIRVQSEEESCRNEVVDAIQTVVATNFTRSVPMEQDCIIALKGQRGNDTRRKLAALNVNVDIEIDAVKFRGSSYCVEQAVGVMKLFEIANFCASLPLDEDDCSSLINGGPTDSIVKRAELQYNVEIYVSRTNRMGYVRGSEEEVKLCVTYLRALLDGDESAGSMLFSVDPEALPVLIGKGGAGAKLLEEEHGVKIDFLKSQGKVRIRKSSNASNLLKAKIAILAVVENMRTTIVVELEGRGEGCEYGNRSVHDIVTETRNIFDVEIAQNDDYSRVSIAGPSRLVEEARQFVVECWTDRACFQFAVDPKQNAVLGSYRHTNIARIELKHKVTIELAASPSCLVIQGACDAVVKAHADILRMLDAIFPSQFFSVAMSRQCLNQVGSYICLQAIMGETCAIMHVDRRCSCVRVRGEVDSVSAAVEILRGKMAEWANTHFTIDIEDFLIPSLLGKGGMNIQARERETRLKIRLNKIDRRLEIEGKDVISVEAGIRSLNAWVELLRSQHWERKYDANILGIIIGKSGATINKLRADTRAFIEVDNASGKIMVTGEVTEVMAAKEAIEKIAAEEQANSFEIHISASPQALPLVIGTKGSNIKEVQNQTGCKIGINRNENVIILRGKELECSRAAQILVDMLDREGFVGHTLSTRESKMNTASQQFDEKSWSSEGSADLNQKLPLKAIPGATPDMLARIKEMSMSWSASRRLRRKLNRAPSNTVDGNMDDDDDRILSNIAASPLPISIDVLDALLPKKTETLDNPLLSESDSDWSKVGSTTNVGSRSEIISLERAVSDHSVPTAPARADDSACVAKINLPSQGMMDPSMGGEIYYKTKSGFCVRL